MTRARVAWALITLVLLGGILLDPLTDRWDFLTAVLLEFYALSIGVAVGGLFYALDALDPEPEAHQ